MSLLELIGIGVLGGIGALCRFGLDSEITGRLGGAFPYGTLTVNLLGSFVLGVLAGATLRGTSSELVETGLIGSFTTFSTWVFETHRLGEDDQLLLAVINLLLSLLLGLCAVWAGRRVGASL